VLIFSIKMANVYVCGAVAIATLNVLSNRRTQARYFNSINVIAHHTGNYAFIDFKQWLTLIFADWNRWLFLLSKRNKRNLNSRWVVIFVLRLAKPLSENNQWFCSAKVKVTYCLRKRTWLLWVHVYKFWRSLIVAAIIMSSSLSSILIVKYIYFL